MVDPYQPPSGLGEAEPGAQLSTGHYEFDDRENQVIVKAARYTRLWGIIALVVGGFVLVSAIAGAAFPFIFADDLDDASVAFVFAAVVLAVSAPFVIVNLITGWYFLNSGRSLYEVVDTAGNDVELLMYGLDQMAKAFRIEAIVIIIGVVVSISLQIVPYFISAVGSAVEG